jgi:hypothetical protein
MYNWVLTTILNRRKQEKGVIPAWVPPPQVPAAGYKRRRSTDPAQARGGAGAPDGEDGGAAAGAED